MFLIFPSTINWLYVSVPAVPKIFDKTYIKIRMWANAQHDSRPAEYRWRPLFNAAKFGWRPLLECRAVTPPKRETR